MTEILSSEIRESGTISFARFMELALYCPVCGYYEAETDTIGKRGDYYTSVSVGNIFGELLAAQFSAWLKELPAAERTLYLLEAGSHQGTLARDILEWLQSRRPELCERLQYIIVEPSTRRQGWQQETLKSCRSRVRWISGLDALNERSLNGIIFSNELLDAMPAHRITWDAARQKWFEWGVTLRDSRFAWRRMDPQQHSESPAALAAPSMRTDFLPDSALPDLPPALLQALPDGFTTELCPAAIQWWTHSARILRSGKLLTLDYGLTAEEFFSPDRKEGTLRAYAGHQLLADLLGNPGEQDITAHVNFTALQAAGENGGLITELFTTQEEFLVRIADRCLPELQSTPGWTSAQIRQFKTLTHPDHMGRRFRVLVQARS